MKIGDSLAAYASSAGAAGGGQNGKQSNSKMASSLSPTPSSSDSSVSISGEGIMLSRLFSVTDPSAVPATLSGTNGMSLANVGSSPLRYLTSEDRAMLSQMYQYAKQQGADPQYVDQIAYTLGGYRKMDNGQTTLNFNSGTNFDAQGHQLTVSFSAKDAAVADRISNSEAIKTTTLDRGFLNYVLDPGYGALSCTCNLGFLEQMVQRFSKDGLARPLDPSYSSYRAADIPVANAVISASKDVTNPSPAATFVADYTSINGVGHWRTPELAAAAVRGTAPSSAMDLRQLLKYW